jgi:hypothetical protein
MQRIDELNLEDVECYTRTKLVVNINKIVTVQRASSIHTSVFSFIFFFVKRVVGRGGETLFLTKGNA